MIPLLFIKKRTIASDQLKTVGSNCPTHIGMNCHRQILRRFSNDNGNEKENVTSKLTFGDLWLFCDYPILFTFYNIDEIIFYATIDQTQAKLENNSDD